MSFHGVAEQLAGGLLLLTYSIRNVLFFAVTHMYLWVLLSSQAFSKSSSHIAHSFFIAHDSMAQSALRLTTLGFVVIAAIYLYYYMEWLHVLYVNKNVSQLHFLYHSATKCLNMTLCTFLYVMGARASHINFHDMHVQITLSFYIL